MFSCIPILSIWKKTKHNSERDLWFCLCFLHLLSGFGQVVKKCKESQGWNNLYLNAIVSFKQHCSFFYTLSKYFWLDSVSFVIEFGEEVDKYPVLKHDSIQFFVFCTCHIYIEFKSVKIPSLYLPLLDNDMKSIRTKVLQQLHLFLTCVYGGLAGDHRVTLCCKGKQ